jgi:hypothetical protein
VIVYRLAGLGIENMFYYRVRRASRTHGSTHSTATNTSQASGPSVPAVNRDLIDEIRMLRDEIDRSTTADHRGVGRESGDAQ